MSDETPDEVAVLRRQLAASTAREQVLRQLLNGIPATIYATYRDGTIAFVNATFAAQWGWRPEECEGRALGELFAPEVAAAWQSVLEAGLNSDGPMISQETYGEGEGARHYDNLRFPIRDAAGVAIALGGVATDITDRVRAEANYEDTRLILEGIVTNAPAVIAVKSPERRLMLVNDAYAALVGQPGAALVGRSEDEVLPAEVAGGWRDLGGDLFGHAEATRTDDSFSVAGETHNFLSTHFPIYNRDRQPFAICTIATNVTALKRVEEQRVQLQSEIIEAQRASLRELSTPLIPLAEGVMVMPLVGTIDTSRATQIMEVLLEGIAAYQAEVVIMDISGVRVVDTQVADALLRAARAANLLGAKIVLTGISAEVAQTIVHLGADLQSVVTQANLQAGLRFALGDERLRL